MADIKNRINDDVKAAMRSKDKQRLAALRLIQAAFKQKEVDERIDLSDEQVLAILNKMAKQHRDSIMQFEQAGRDDLVQVEQQELNIIKTYLPSQLSEDEINAIIESAVVTTEANSIKDMGKVMAALKEPLQGRADMAKVSSLIKARLAG